VGLAVGAGVGWNDTDGVAVELAEGASVGLIVIDGAVVGLIVGIAEGWAEIDGVAVGIAVGSVVGPSDTDGAADGWFDETVVEFTVVVVVGAWLECVVGETEGIVVAVGALDGLWVLFKSRAVGTTLGMALGDSVVILAWIVGNCVVLVSISDGALVGVSEELTAMVG
jgi:hypothetical protein